MERVGFATELCSGRGLEIFLDPFYAVKYQLEYKLLQNLGIYVKANKG